MAPSHSFSILATFFYTKNLEGNDYNNLAINITPSGDKKSHDKPIPTTICNTEDIQKNIPWALNGYMYRTAIDQPVEYLEDIIDITNGTKENIAHKIFGNDVKNIQKSIDSLSENFISEKDLKNFDSTWSCCKKRITRNSI